MNYTSAEKIRIVMKRKGLGNTDLATRLGISVQNLSNKLARDNFSETDLRAVAQALNCKLEIFFVLEDGSKV